VSPVEFDDLPFNDRADLTPYLIHLTRRSGDGDSALKNLFNILKTGTVWGSTSSGFIKGARSAACLMDVPFVALKHICSKKNEKRYEPYGIVVTKKYAYKAGARPVLYLSNEELRALKIPAAEKWRVVRLEVSDDGGWISWLHEREWRCPEELRLPKQWVRAVLVKNSKDAHKLQGWLDEDDEVACRPWSILPLEIVCQGLTS
jgi:hypothetical protein